MMKNSKFKTGIVMGMIAFLFAFSANAQSRERKAPPTFSEMDTNNDGKLAESELEGRLKNDFSKIDTDSDGFISEEEFQNAPKPERRGKR